MIAKLLPVPTNYLLLGAVLVAVVGRHAGAVVASARPDGAAWTDVGRGKTGTIAPHKDAEPQSRTTPQHSSEHGSQGDDNARPVYVDTGDVTSGDDAPYRVEEGYVVHTSPASDHADKNIAASERRQQTSDPSPRKPTAPSVPPGNPQVTSVPQTPNTAEAPVSSSASPPSSSRPAPTVVNNASSSPSNISSTSPYPDLPPTTDSPVTLHNTTNNTQPNTNIPHDTDSSTHVPLGNGDLPYDSPTGVLPIFTSTSATGSRRHEDVTSQGLASPVRYSDSLGRPVFRSEEERLLDYLFREYNPSARPVINSSKSVQVSIQFSLMHFQELNVKSQILTSTGLLIMEWVDERLRWDPREFNLNEIVISAKMLWVPEFAVINGAEEIYGDYREFRAIITSDGNIRWEPGGVFKTMCEIDITYFPFDEQHCALVFGAWSYHTTKMNLTNSSATINLDSYERNGEWEILTTKVSRDEFFYECCPKERFSNVAFRLHMRRRYTFYVMNVILPSMVTSILLLSIFYCPPGQKVQIGVVVLLSFRIFLLNVTDSIPKTSDHIPLLGIYLTCTMAITTLSMVLTVMVLNLHSISERPVPRWVRIVVLRHLARLFCVGTDEVEANKKDEKANHVKKKKRKGVGRMSATLVEDDGEEHMPIIAINGAVNAGHGQETSFVHMRSGSYANLRINNNTAAFGEGTSTARQEEEKPDFSKDWHKLAEVVDRLFFWTFLLAIVAISILLFHPLTKNYLIPRPNPS